MHKNSNFEIFESVLYMKSGSMLSRESKDCCFKKDTDTENIVCVLLNLSVPYIHITYSILKAHFEVCLQTIFQIEYFHSFFNKFSLLVLLFFPPIIFII